MTTDTSIKAPQGTIYALVIWLFLIGCAPSLAPIADNGAQAFLKQNSLLDKIINKDTIRVGTTGDYVPFSYQLSPDETEYHGVDIELAKDLGRSLGVEVIFVLTSWPTLMDDLLADRFDIGMTGITITLSRQTRALFSVPIDAGGKSAIARDEDVYKYRSISDINKKGVRVIVNPGGTNEVFVDRYLRKATIIRNEDNLSIFQKIVDGEADVMVTDAVETRVQELLHPELEAVNPDNPFNYFEKGFLLPRDFIFKAYVDQWIRLRKKDGTYQRIFDAELMAIEKSVQLKDDD